LELWCVTEINRGSTEEIGETVAEMAAASKADRAGNRYLHSITIRCRPNVSAVKTDRMAGSAISVYIEEKLSQKIDR